MFGALMSRLSNAVHEGHLPKFLSSAMANIIDVHADNHGRVPGGLGTCLESDQRDFLGTFDTFTDILKLWWQVRSKPHGMAVWAGMKFTAKGAVNIILGFINRLIQGWNKYPSASLDSRFPIGFR